MYETLGGKPAHNTLAYHWARLVEILYSAENMVRLLDDDEIMSDNIRTLPTEKPTEGVGAVEAPRGTLIHHYKTDERGVITQANLIVATVANAAAICMSVERAARGLIKDGVVNDALLNMVEMAFRAYDPCFGCATHSMPGQMPLVVEVKDPEGNVVERLSQFVDG
jgi:F420-non-reducing hydrogenase large subunit